MTNLIQELTMSDNDRHVVPHADGGWDVKAPHAERASSHHDTQAEAILRAREIIGNAGGGELVTHGMDGRIRESDTVAAAGHDIQEAVEIQEAVDIQEAVEQPAVVDRMAPPVDPSTIDLGERASTDAPPIRQGASEEEEPKPTLGDKLKSLLHRSSD
jgi:predicted RNase H-like HicB family nuclease